MQKCKQQNWRAYGKSIHLCCVTSIEGWIGLVSWTSILSFARSEKSHGCLVLLFGNPGDHESAEVAGYSAPWSSWPDHVTAGPNIPKSIQEQGWSTLSNWTVTILPTNVLALLACLAPLGRGPSNFVMSYEGVPHAKIWASSWVASACSDFHSRHSWGVTFAEHDWHDRRGCECWNRRKRVLDNKSISDLQISWYFLNHDVCRTRASLVQLRSAFQLLDKLLGHITNHDVFIRFILRSYLLKRKNTVTHSGLQISPHTDNAMTLQSLRVRKTCATVQSTYYMICTIKKRKEGTIEAQRTQGRNGSHMVERCGRFWVFTPAQPLHLQLPRPDFHARTRPSPPAKLAALGTALRVTSLD